MIICSIILCAPLTRDELAALIAKRPHIYGRFSAFLKTLPGGDRHECAQ